MLFDVCKLKIAAEAKHRSLGLNDEQRLHNLQRAYKSESSHQKQRLFSLSFLCLGEHTIRTQHNGCSTVKTGIYNAKR